MCYQKHTTTAGTLGARRGHGRKREQFAQGDRNETAGTAAGVNYKQYVCLVHGTSTRGTGVNGVQRHISNNDSSGTGCALMSFSTSKVGNANNHSHQTFKHSCCQRSQRITKPTPSTGCSRCWTSRGTCSRAREPWQKLRGSRVGVRPPLPSTPDPRSVKITCQRRTRRMA